VNVELLELAAAALSDLLAEVVFVGGATVELWITDPGAPPVRPTQDVDVSVEVTTRAALHEFEAKLRARGFTARTKRTALSAGATHPPRRLPTAPQIAHG
jgi:hypothetical protein